MNTDNLGVSGPGVGVTTDPYGHHHLTHPHLLPPHHSHHPSSIYCSSSHPYTELFSPFSADFAASHETGTNTGVPTDYLTLQNSLDYVSHHPHHHHHHPPPTHHQHQQQQQQQQQQQHHHHQIPSSSNGERTPSSVGTGVTGSDASPSHSFGKSSGYSSAADYYNASVLGSKTALNNANTSTANSTNSSNTSTTNTSSHSPYDGASTASTSSPPQSTGYLTANVKQETMMPGPFAIDPHSNYGTSRIRFHPILSSLSRSRSGNVNESNSTANTGGTNPSNFAHGIDDYGSSLYHPSAASAYSSYSPSGLLQTSYPVGPYGVSHPDHMRLYSSQLKHDFG